MNTHEMAISIRQALLNFMTHLRQTVKVIQLHI